MKKYLTVLCLTLLGSGQVALADDSPAPAAASKQAPEFADIEQWINSEPLTMDELKGKVVVIHFWAYGCINCVHNLPHYQKWQKDFAGKDLVIVGIHTPETAEEKQPDNVKAAVVKREIKYPVAIDGSATMWKKWGTRLWPSVALVDRQGEVRYVWEGELNWEGKPGEAKMRANIKQLLAEPKKRAKKSAPNVSNGQASSSAASPESPN